MGKRRRKFTVEMMVKSRWELKLKNSVINVSLLLLLLLSRCKISFFFPSFFSKDGRLEQIMLEMV